MCYNIAILKGAGKNYFEYYHNLFPSPQEQQYKIDFVGSYFVSGFTHPKLPIVKTEGIELYSWGLIPSWVKDIQGAKDIRTKTLNAVGETVFEKPSFRSSIKTKRGLLGVSGFYEWRDVNKVKYPYFVKLKDEEIFSLGCIYENWVDRSTGEIFNTFSIITTPANPLMEKIHNLKKRMPLIIPRNKEEQWIDSKLSADKIKELIQPFDENLMDAYTVSQNVNSAKNNRNVPESIEQVEYKDITF